MSCNIIGLSSLLSVCFLLFNMNSGLPSNDYIHPSTHPGPLSVPVTKSGN